MTTDQMVLLVLLILVIGAFPAWPYSRAWGYGPMSALTVIVVILVVYALVIKPSSRPAGESLRSDVRAAGQDLKEMGRDAADTVRDAVK